MSSFTLFVGLALVVTWINFFIVWVVRFSDTEGDYLGTSGASALCVAILVIECYFLRGRESTSITNYIVISGSVFLSVLCAVRAIKLKKNREESSMTKLERLKNKQEKLSWKLRECERQIEEEERKERYRDYRPASASETVKITSPMPGKIICVNVSEGDCVKKGDVLLVVEAMKMENDIIAPRNGRVVQMIAKQGDIVEHGNVLVEIEP